MRGARRLGGVKTAVLGAGKTGEACAKFLLARGAEVSISAPEGFGELGRGVQGLRDEGVKFFTGPVCESAVDEAELVVASPGVPRGSPQVERALCRGIEIVDEAELFSWFCGSPIIAVTGTNGKTTTAVLISNLMNGLGYRTVPAGNIGLPLTALPPGAFDGSVPVVCEMSSFQLERVASFRPFVSVVLNVSPDHLDRHGSFDEYVRAKSNIILRQTGEDFAVLNRDCPVCRGFSELTEARVVWFGLEEGRGDCLWAEGGKIMGRLDGKRLEAPAGDDVRVNVYDALAAGACCLIYGGDGGVFERMLKGFGGLPHRREFAGEINGVKFYNDSKATNAAAFLDGLRALGGNIIAVSGGKDKGIDYSFMLPEVSARVKRMVLLGETAAALEASFGESVPCEKVRNMGDAVRKAFRGAAPGDKIALIPGTSSFDMFENYEARGGIFKEEVRKLSREAAGER